MVDRPVVLPGDRRDCLGVSESIRGAKDDRRLRGCAYVDGERVRTDVVADAVLSLDVDRQRGRDPSRSRGVDERAEVPKSEFVKFHRDPHVSIVPLRWREPSVTTLVTGLLDDGRDSRQEVARMLGLTTDAVRKMVLRSRRHRGA